MDTFHRFKDRLSAGALLARELSGYAQRPDVLVVALPRGGVPVGYAIALALQVPLDVLVVRKIGLPGQEEHALGAIASGGLCIWQTELLSTLDLSAEVIDNLAQQALREIARREKAYRGDRAQPQFRERTVILVDDGVATGATMQVALHVVRQANPACLIVAVPVAAADALAILRPGVDKIVCLETPAPFHAVGAWYDNFAQTSDDEVMQLLHDAERKQRSRRIRPPTQDAMLDTMLDTTAGSVHGGSDAA